MGPSSIYRTSNVVALWPQLPTRNPRICRQVATRPQKNQLEPSSATGQGGAEAGFLVQLVVVHRNQWMPEDDRHERTDSGLQHRTMKNKGLIAHSTPETR